MIGKTLSHYKVLEKIGQGGMGEVYRAEDTNLDREVAIKVLPEQFTQDPQRLARFEREAKLLAQLNHPNIAAIYGFEKADGVHFLALELVLGETLAERVAKGPVPVEEALEVCRQIAEGVEAAHEKGVIHRDLKPANVKVTPEGKVKILDFGLAKAFEGEPPVTDISQSPTLTEEMTRAGVILGTAAYMSPEQAKGKPVDKRADIFAFGAILYELLTGRRAFQGETITETIAAVLKSNPDWEQLPGDTPWRIKELLRRCLTKDPHDRLRDVANVGVETRLALAEPTRELPLGTESETQSAVWKRTLPWLVTAVVVLIAGVSVWTLTRPVRQLPRRFVVSPSPDRPLADRPGRDIAISPDGNHIVYVAKIEGTTQLYLRSLAGFTATPIAGTEGAMSPFFLPDSRSLVFVAGEQLKRISLTGGSPTTLCEVTTLFRGGSWVPGEAIVFSAGAGSGGALYLVSATGGDPQILAVPDTGKGERFYMNPTTLPGGKTVLFSISGVKNWVAALSLETREVKILREGGPKVAYASTGHLLYGSDGVLMAVPFDPEKLVEIGEPRLALEGLLTRVDIDFSSDGTLIYVPGESTRPNWMLVSVDFAGNATSHRQIQTFEQPRVSPDGRKAAFAVTGPPYARSGAWGDLFTYDLESDTLSRLTFDGLSHAVIWSPDGKWLIFESSRNGPANIFRAPADGSGEVEELVGGPNAQWPSSFSPDGQVLAYTEADSANDLDIWTVSLNGDFSPQPFLQTPATEWGAMFSPDGRWIAYTSNESGSQEVYVRPYGESSGKWQISTDGGREPVWSPKERKLFYRNRDGMMVVDFTTEPTFAPGSPRILFEEPYRFHGGGYEMGGWSNHDIYPSGQQFLMIQAIEQEDEDVVTRINVVLNWFEELKRLVPTP